MTTLTEKESSILKSLQSIDGEDSGEIPGFKMVYLDNGIDTDSKAVRGVLGSLEKKGFYKPEDGFAWGWVEVSTQ